MAISLFFSCESSKNESWIKAHGDSLFNEGNAVVEMDDKGFLIAGTTEKANGDYDMFIMKTDSLGESEWSQLYGGDFPDIAYSICKAVDSGFVFVGATKSFGKGSSDILIYKIDNLGNLIWSRVYGEEQKDIGLVVRRTKDKGYIIAGCTESLGIGNSDIILIKTDSDGEYLWGRTYGEEEEEIPWDIQVTSDSGFILVGATSSYGISNSDIFVMKINCTGDISWVKYFGEDKDDCGTYVQETDDGNYIIAGWKMREDDNDIYVIKLKPNGDSLWAKVYDAKGNNMALFIDEIEGNCYTLIGQTASSTNRCIIHLLTVSGDGNKIVAHKLEEKIVCDIKGATRTSNGDYILVGIGNDDVLIGRLKSSMFPSLDQQ